MNPLVSKLLTGLLRQALTGVAGWLIAHGIINQADETQLISGLVMGAGSLGWALYTRYKDHLTLVTALASPMGSTIASVNQAVASGQTAPVMTPANVPPRVLALLMACALGGLTLGGCSQNPQVNLLHGSQSLTAALQAFQQSENGLCGVDVKTPTHCDQTYPGVTAAQLDSVHQQAEKLIGKFATDKIVFDKAAAAWQPGQGAPASLSQLLADAQLVQTTFASLPGGAPAGAVLSAIQSVVTIVTDLISSLQGK